MEGNIDEIYMHRCLQLARNGRETTRPNPMVGAVIVCDGRIIGEGYHHKCGGPHAEVEAIASVRQPELLIRSTMYVSLEPCAHYGKTPPCADLIIAKRIPRVVVGCRDSFAKVNGLGIRKLRDAGVEVKVGVLEKECLRLNERFFTCHSKGRPFVILKWAQSEDGFLDITRKEGDGKRPIQFSTPTTTALVHRLRAQEDAILVGARTALLDNPSLTVRRWCGKNPLRLVIDLQGTLPLNLHLFDGTSPTCAYVLKDRNPVYKDKIEVVGVDEKNVLDEIMADLASRDVQSLIVEGGAATLRTFIDRGMWDEARVELSPMRLGAGVKVPQLDHVGLVEEVLVDGNVIRYFRPKV